jgi:transposase
MGVDVGENTLAATARAVGIEVVHVDPVYTSQTCSDCSSLGRRLKHRFVRDQ